MFAAGGPAATAAGVVGGAATGYGQLKGAQNLIQDSTPKMPAWQHAAMFPLTGGLDTIAAKLGLDWGHSKNYYAAKDRSKLLQSMLGENQTALEFDSPNGPISITPKQFAKDPTTYNYFTPEELKSGAMSDGQKRDIGIGQALGWYSSNKSGKNKQFTDMTGLYANLSKKGVSPQSLTEAYGLDHDKLYGAVHLAQQKGEISQEFGDALKNGLDESFGVGAYAGGKKPNAQKQATPAAQSSPQPAAAARTPVKSAVGQRYKIPVRR
jgi:hypothetical protein